MSFFRLTALACLWSLVLLSIATATPALSVLQSPPLASAVAWAFAALLELALSQPSAT